MFSRDEFVEGTPILAKLAEYQIDLIVLAGFMNKISDALLTAYPGKIINIHPALLPKHGGKGMYGIDVYKRQVFFRTDLINTSIHEGTPERLFTSLFHVLSTIAFILLSHSSIRMIRLAGTRSRLTSGFRFCSRTADRSPQWDF